MSRGDWVIICAVAAVLITVVAIYDQLSSGIWDHPLDDQRRWIRTQEAAVHERGNRGSPVVATLDHGTQVRIWETAEKWTKISAPRTDDDPVESVVGWVCDIHLASMEMERVVEAYEDPYLCEASIAEGWVDVPVANLRSGPGADHPIVGKAKASQYVDIHEQREGWARVSVPMVKADGKVLAGWIRGDLIRGTYVAATKPKTAKPSRQGAGASICRTLSLGDFEPLIYKMERPRRRVYVTNVWYTLQVDRKQAVIMYFSECHGLTHVIDSMTGKEVGTHSVMGYRVHQ